jgi:hypothetical protein
MARRGYKGIAKKTTLTADMLAGSTNFTVVDPSGWPDGITAFVVTLDRAGSSEERKLCTRAVGSSTLEIVSQWDGTVAKDHLTGTVVEHTHSATDADEANEHRWDAAHDHHAQYLNVARHDLTARHPTAVIADAAITVAKLAVVARTHPAWLQWAIASEIKVPVADADFIIPGTVFVPAGWTAVISRVRYKINSGTSVSFKLQKNGVDLTGFTALSATTTDTTTDPADQAVVDLDQIAPVVTGVSGTPKNLKIAVEVLLTRTV